VIGDGPKVKGLQTWGEMMSLYSGAESTKILAERERATTFQDVANI